MLYLNCKSIRQGGAVWHRQFRLGVCPPLFSRRPRRGDPEGRMGKPRETAGRKAVD